MRKVLVANWLRLRIRWWSIATARVVMRHWQWLVLAALLLPMGTKLHVLLLILAYPLVGALRIGTGLVSHLAATGSMQAVGMLWIFVQRRAVAGGDFARQVGSLPLTLGEKRAVNLAMLVPANTLLLAPFISAAMALTVLAGAASGLGEMSIAAIPVLAELFFLAQLALLEGRAAVILPLVAADLAYSWGLASTSPSLRVTALATSGALGLLALARWPRWRRPSPLDQKRTGQNQRSRNMMLPPAWRIQIKALAADASTPLRATALAAVALGTDALLRVFAFDNRTLPTSALAAAAIALLMAGWYRTLDRAHSRVAGFVRALPLARHFWRWQDLRFIAAIGALPIALVFGLVAVRSPGNLGALGLLLPGYFVLLAALRLPSLHGGRQAALLSFLLAGAWSAAALAATH